MLPVSNPECWWLAEFGWFGIILDLRYLYVYICISIWDSRFRLSICWGTPWFMFLVMLLIHCPKSLGACTSGCSWLHACPVCCTIACSRISPKGGGKASQARRRGPPMFCSIHQDLCLCVIASDFIIFSCYWWVLVSRCVRSPNAYSKNAVTMSTPQDSCRKVTSRGFLVVFILYR